MKNEKHVALAKEITTVQKDEDISLNVENAKKVWKMLHRIEKAIAAALEQVERDALASKVVGPTPHEIEMHRKFGTYDNSFEGGCFWYRDNLKLAPSEQVIRVPKAKKPKDELHGFLDIATDQMEMGFNNCLIAIKRLNPQARIEESNE